MKYLMKYKLFENNEEYSISVKKMSFDIISISFRVNKISEGGVNVDMKYKDDNFKGKKIAYLWGLEVRDKGSGLGTIFLKKIIEYLKNESIDIIMLTVDPDNVPANKLYLKFGFKIIKNVACIDGTDNNYLIYN